MKIMDDHYLRKSRALREAENKWSVIKLLIHVVWVLVGIPPLVWLIATDSSATRYVIIGLSWLLFRWVTVKIFAYEYVYKAIEQINHDFAKPEE